MKVQEKPGQIKPKKKDDIGDQNNNEEKNLNDTFASQKFLDQMNDVDADYNTSGFNLMIQNVNLVKNYQYKNSADFQFANELNQWINENVLFWESGNQPIKFFLPESQFGNNTSQTKIIPQQILYKQNSLFQMNSLLTNQDRQSKNNSSKGQGDEEDLLNKSSKKPKIQLQQQKVYDDLNKQQLSDIWDTGTFTVQLTAGEPETWMVKPWVFYSKERSFRFLKDAFECAKFQFKQIKRRFYIWETIEFIIYNRKNLSVNSENCQCACLDINMLEGLRVLIGIPIHLIILLIGIPLYNVDTFKLKNESNKQIQKRIEDQIKKNNGSKYLDILFLNYLSSNKSTFLNNDFNFQEELELISLAKQVQDGSLQIGQTEEDKQYIKIDLQEKLYESLFNRIEKYYSSKHDLDPEVIKSLEHNFRAYITMQKHRALQINNTRYYGKPESVVKDLKRQKCDKIAELAHLVSEEIKKGVSLYEEIKIQDNIREVSKINRLQFSYFKPRVFKEVDNQGRIKYSADWIRELSVPTSFYFWKIFYFFAASYFMIHKFINFCLQFALYSPCGLKSAIYPNQFATNFLVNPQTGKIEDDHDSMEDTVSRMYKNIKNTAKQNIENFENEPDHGLLGKSITRICNRIENWILRYFFLGFICTNILLRILFLIIGIFALILVPLSLVLAPFYTLLCVIICLICMDFTVPSNHQSWDLPIFAPLLDLLIWRLIIRGAGQIAISVLMIAAHIVFGILLIVFGILIYFLRRLLDVIVFIFIRTCGRIPGGDSYLAWKISRSRNPNTANYYESGGLRRTNMNQNEQVLDQLTLDQIQQLVDAEFHKDILEQYRQQMITKINQPVLQNDVNMKKMSQFLPFDFSKNKVTQGYYQTAEKLKQELNDQISQRKKLLPVLLRKSNMNFKYKHEDILSIFYNLQTYIAEKYGQKQYFKKYMWKNYKCEENNYTNLSLHFLNHIFYDNKSQLNQVLERLTLKEQKNGIQVKQQLDEFIAQKFKQNGKNMLEAPAFVTLSQFIEKALKRLDNNQSLLSMRTDNFMLCDDFMLLNVNKLNN
ncbi:hypothetical protein ABPG72_009083 [Tetrahymena utriculariae]